MAGHNATSWSQALFNVFLAGTTRRTAQRTARWFPTSIQRQRTFTTSHRVTYIKKKPVAVVRKEKRNEEIRAPYIYLADEEGKLSEARRTQDVLRSFDHVTHRLIQLNQDEPNDPNFVPVCRIINMSEEYRKQQASKAAKKDQRKARAAEISIKTLELNWAIGSNDLDHRLKRMKEFLSEGRKVELVLAKKKRGRPATQEECNELLRKVKATVEDVKGAKELKPMEGKIGVFAMMFFQGKPVANTAEAPAASLPESDAIEQATAS